VRHKKVVDTTPPLRYTQSQYHKTTRNAMTGNAGFLRGTENRRMVQGGAQEKSALSLKQCS
jgi:hypothetical protein